MISRLISATLLAGLIAGCAPQQVKPTVQRIPFPAQEYEKLAKDGTSTVKGQIFMKTRGGDVKFGAGGEVLLNPVTSYSKQWFEEQYTRGNQLAAGDERQYLYIRKKVADGNGRFEFKNIPAGEYYVTGGVTWQTATGYQGNLETQGGLLSKKITVGEKDDVEVILSR